jgi:hypothetical protein
MRLCLLPIRPRLSPPPCFSQTGGLRRPYIMVFPTISFIAKCQMSFWSPVLSKPQCHDPPQIVPSIHGVSFSVILLLRRATGVLIYPLARSSSPATLYLMRLTFRLRLHSLDRTLDFLLQDLLPAPASSTSDVRQTRASDDASDPVGLDPAILWHGAAYRLPQAPRQTAPTSTSNGAPTAPLGPGSASITVGVRIQHRLQRRRQWHLSLRSPLRGRLVPEQAPCRPHTAVWIHRGGLQLGVATARLHPRHARRCQLARGDD